MCMHLDDTYISCLHFFDIVNTVDGQHTLVAECVKSWVRLNKAHFYN